MRKKIRIYINLAKLYFQKIISFFYIPNSKEVSSNSSQNDIIINHLKNLGSFQYLPNKGNLGDVVIASSTFEFFEENNLNYKVLDINKIDEITKPFNFVYGGGGIWHELYQKDYQEVIDVFKNNLLQKCIVLPSSFYNCEDAINAMDERFIVFCREEQSYNYCKSINTKATFILADDMVVGANFGLYKQKKYNSKNIKLFFKNNKRKQYKYFVKKIYPFYQKAYSNACNEIKKYKNFNIGFCLRTDKESVISDNLSNIVSIDPSNFAGSFACDKSLDFILTKLFLGVIDLFNVIITDRLHIGICAAKLGKEVYLIDNSYKKVSNVYNLSLKQYKNVHLINFSEIQNCIEQHSENSKPNMELFNSLPNNFNDFLYQYASIKNEYGFERRFWD